MPKLKTKSSAKKRFSATGTGKLKRNFVLGVMKLGGMYEEYKGLLINYEKDEHAANDINHLIEMKDEAVPLAVSLINEYVDHLDDDYLNERFNRNYE